jgi:hypothetical protein
MSYSRTSSVDTVNDVYEPTLHAPPVVPADKAASAEVLITEQEILFGTVAALAAPRRRTGRRLMAREIDRL